MDDDMCLSPLICVRVCIYSRAAFVWLCPSYIYLWEIFSFFFLDSFLWWEPTAAAAAAAAAPTETAETADVVRQRHTIQLPMQQ